MSLTRRLRGLIGTALIWSGIGAAVGIPAFFAVFHPWTYASVNLSRAVQLFAKWEVASLIWGFATGVSFGLIVMALERTRGWGALSRRRLTAWGALAGGIFPALLSIRPLQSGSSPVYFGLIIGASALVGAAWARASFAIARRAPHDTPPAILPRDSAETLRRPSTGTRTQHASETL